MTSSTDYPHGPRDESFLFATNAGFLEELFRRYDNNPEQVSSAWRQHFDSLNGGGDTMADSATQSPRRPKVRPWPQHGRPVPHRNNRRYCD